MSLLPVIAQRNRSAPLFVTLRTTVPDEEVVIRAINAGTYNCEVDWGDGTVSTVTSYNDADLTHTFADTGDHKVVIKGDFGMFSFSNVAPYDLQVVSAGGKLISDSNNWTSAFYGCSNLEQVDMSQWDTSGVQYMPNMFFGCTNLSEVKGISNLDVSSVRNFSRTFQACSSLLELDVSQWDTSSAATMAIMFYYCSSLTELDVSNFNTANVTDMGYMFAGCQGLTSLDVANWDVSKVGGMHVMFNQCENLVSLDVSQWVTTALNSIVTMFWRCRALTTIDISGWDVSKVTSLYRFVSECHSLVYLDGAKFNGLPLIANALYAVFNACYALSSVDVSGWNVSGCDTMYFTFDNCRSLTSIDISSWDLSNCTNFTRAFSNSAFDQTTVDSILAKCDSAGQTGAITLDIQGYLNSPPSAAGLVSKANLEAKGWTVNVNS